MAIVGMNAAGTDQADDVEPTARPRRSITGVDEGRPSEERAVSDGSVDPRKVLQHRSARPEVEMADLGVAHLAVRQANRVF
jgi:hypothetical protein